MTQAGVERLGWTLIHVLWQGVLIAAVYAIARSRLAKNGSAQARYVLGCAALTAIALAPIFTYGLIGTSSSLSAATRISSVAVRSSDPAVESAPFESLPTAPPIVWSDQILPLLVFAWFAGATIFSVRLLGGWIAAARMKSALIRPVPREWRESFHRLQARVGVSRPVKLMVSALVQVPTVVGWLRPAVLVPVGALSGIAPEYMQALLAHELAHIRRRDYLVNILQSVVEALLFYHPAVWWISGHIRVERELCCDEIAVESNAALIPRQSRGL
jgi:beta-lactamase regulating signal transducer with metallopeptidase domain